MIQEPDRGVLVVLLERHCKAVANVALALGNLTEQDANNALLSVPSCPIVVVYNREQDQRM